MRGGEGALITARQRIPYHGPSHSIQTPPAQPVLPSLRPAAPPSILSAPVDIDVFGFAPTAADAPCSPRAVPHSLLQARYRSAAKQTLADGPD